MKKLLLLFLILPTIINAQETNLDLSVPDKKLTDFEWKEDVLYVETSYGTRTYGNKKGLEHKIIQLSDYSKKDVYSSEKLSSKVFLNKEGALVVESGNSYAASRVLLKNSSPFTFFDANGGEMGIIEKIDNSKIYYDGINENTFLSKSQLIGVGPKSKKERDSKKEREGKPIEWFLYKTDLNSMEQSTMTFNLDGKSGSFFLIDVGLDRFYICKKEYIYNDKNIDGQKFKMYQYDFDGNQIGKTELSVSIDDPNNYNYAYAQLRRGFRFNQNSGSPSVLVSNELATGSIYVDEVNKRYYVVSLLKGEKDDIGMRAKISNFDFEGNLIWSINEPFSEESFSSRQTKYMSFDPVLTKEKAYFINLLGELVIVNNDGSVEKSLMGEATYKKVNDKLGSSISWKYGIILKSLSKKLLLNKEATIAYSSNENVASYLKTLKPKSYTFINVHFSKHGTIHLLQIGDKEREVKLLKF